ncbi:hypothetical protein BC939DRAFT_505801 [Gamsiella multidivaricata]|uniref:uncharacterized protein n=1 Tax=Gamsiella multidivaricata TaxID=101098 RepID=UPI00221EB483|nr:uncharacterized protein BC939DRAFT_505801 [Gamsiella multidivaricata]KAI7819282.1 hypothetical protein BC939DRAFT_505801 [Gamsiella multidivaricata]
MNNKTWLLLANQTAHKYCTDNDTWSIIGRSVNANRASGFAAATDSSTGLVYVMNGWIVNGTTPIQQYQPAINSINTQGYGSDQQRYRRLQPKHQRLAVGFYIIRSQPNRNRTFSISHYIPAIVPSPVSVGTIVGGVAGGLAAVVAAAAFLFYRWKSRDQPKVLSSSSDSQVTDDQDRLKPRSSEAFQMEPLMPLTSPQEEQGYQDQHGFRPNSGTHNSAPAYLYPNTSPGGSRDYGAGYSGVSASASGAATGVESDVFKRYDMIYRSNEIIVTQSWTTNNHTVGE